MSGKLMAAIGADPTLENQTDRLILLGIASRADDEGHGARPTNAELAQWALRSRRTVVRRLAALEQDGRFTRTRLRRDGKDWRWEYTVRIPSGDTEMSPQQEPPRGDTEMSSQDHPRGDTQMASQVRPCTSPGTSIAASTRAGGRDLLFEAVAEVCGIDWHQLTPTGRGPLNRAVKEICAAGGTPEQVRARARRWPYDVPLTAMALTKHWADLAPPPPPPPSFDPYAPGDTGGIDPEGQRRIAELLRSATRRTTT